LPQVDAEIDHAAARTGRSFSQVHRRRAEDLAELSRALADHGAVPRTVVTGYETPGLTWQTERGGTWAALARGQNAYLAACYDGPVGGLHSVLPLLLPPDGPAAPTGTTSAFARYLIGRFPQLHEIAPDEVELPGYCGTVGDQPGCLQPGGFIALFENSALTGRVDERTRVLAEFHNVGMDLLLYLADHLTR